jgi:hypothetical protein
MKPFRGIENVRALPGLAVEVVFKGERRPWSVELEAWIDDVEVLKALRDAEVFGTARVGFGGAAIVWGRRVDEDEGEIDMDGEQLWRMAGEQAGELMPTAAFRAWRARHGLTVTAAAEALGLSRRMVTYYDSGAWPVPKPVMLACEGWEARQRRAAA